MPVGGSARAPGVNEDPSTKSMPRQRRTEIRYMGMADVRPILLRLDGAPSQVGRPDAPVDSTVSAKTTSATIHGHQRNRRSPYETAVFLFRMVRRGPVLSSCFSGLFGGQGPQAWLREAPKNA